ncbi:hypothetical protein LOAG_01784 [Loa loa]|uniref:Ovule protein n=1 Tax=Loa loa TaxID=7209 RepID=A0A1I7VBG9_LOALO|nr:hypothetical protein LOAG_01784 [Loa loa]EFO26694.2 hypothetical protein LOAG_01784 [Loa loa]
MPTDWMHLSLTEDQSAVAELFLQLSLLHTNFAKIRQSSSSSNYYFLWCRGDLKQNCKRLEKRNMQTTHTDK